MMYVGLGTGNIIERNKLRMQYVDELSKNDNKLEVLINKFTYSLNSNDAELIEKSIGDLFYEEISNDAIDSTVEMFRKLDNVDKFKNMMIQRYKNRPEMGFVWNCYDILVRKAS